MLGVDPETMWKSHGPKPSCAHIVVSSSERENSLDVIQCSRGKHSDLPGKRHRDNKIPNWWVVMLVKSVGNGGM